MGNLRDDVKFRIPEDKQREIAARHNTNMQNTTQNKRNLRNQTAPHRQKYSEDGKLKRIIAIVLASATLVGGAIALKNYNDYKKDIKELNTTDIEVQIEEEARKQGIMEELEFDGQNFNSTIKCDRPELYKVLSNTDLDEILNRYFENPTDEAKANILKQLEGREEEFAKFNMDLIEASFADSKGVSIDDISMRAVFNHYTEKEGQEIIEGKSSYQGHTLSVQGIDLRTSEDITRLISDARFNELAPNSSYFDKDKTQNERGIDIYKNIKQVLVEHDFSIKNGKVVLEGKDGKTYEYSKDILGNAKMSEIKQQEVERE